MNLKEFEKIEIDRFMGLYKRGMADQCPADHAICCQNVDFTSTGQVNKRPGVETSLVLNHVVKRQYLTTFNSGDLRMITLDDNGNLYQDANPIPIYSLTGMFDFHLLNLFGKVFFLPITNLGTSPKLQVWNGTDPVRDAAGLAPTSSFSAADGAAAATTGLDPGLHKFAVCFVTNTGFTTSPGPKIAGTFTPVTYTAPGAKKVDLSGIPIGPLPQTVGRVILATKANEEEYFFVPGGTINDNVTTTLTLDFFDTSLAISADYLFDLLEFIPTQDPTGTGAGMLASYHARTVIPVGRITRLSRIQEPEAFNNVNGYINTPLAPVEFAQSAFVLRDVLYIGLAVGLYSTQDNLDEPGTWDVRIVDGAISFFKDSISTIASNITALGISEVVLLANREGIFVFDGVVQRPELSWKIKDVWDGITHGAERNICVEVDFYKKLIYVLLPVEDSTVPNVMLMADYSEMEIIPTTKTIKWTYHFFPFVPYSIGMAYFTDVNSTDYFLRIGSQTDHALFKLRVGLLNDLVTNPIDSRYCCYLATVEKGTVNLFRALRLRARGQGTIELQLAGEDFQVLQAPLQLLNGTTQVGHNPAQELLRQTNFMNEKMSVQVRNNELNAQMQIDRIDIFGKRIFAARPQ